MKQQLHAVQNWVGLWNEITQLTVTLPPAKSFDIYTVLISYLQYTYSDKTYEHTTKNFSQTTVFPNCTKGISGIVCIKAARQTYQDQKIKKENSFSGHLTEEVTVPVSIETQFLLLLKQG